MNKLTALALARTLLLMRDDLKADVSDEELLDALTSTIVVIVADKPNLSSHSAQSAFVTAAMLMARSAHQVHVLAPDLRLLERQPPLLGERIISALVAASDNLVPGVALRGHLPNTTPDLEIRIGDTPSRIRAKRSIVLSASNWSGAIGNSPTPWPVVDAPLGGLAAAALASGEAFKISMLKLIRYAISAREFGARFAPCLRAHLNLAPTDTPLPQDLERFDVVSGGAIANSFLYSLLRFRSVRGSGRIFDFDLGDITNLNRNVLMQCSDVGTPKVEFLAKLFSKPLVLEPNVHPVSASRRCLRLTSRIVVGVDHIPTRWTVQAYAPMWLGVGATSHWSAMASFHRAGLACARCLHPEDDPNDAPVPTVAFVSFWSGLLLAGYFAQSLAGREKAETQQSYLTAVRPETLWQTPVERRAACPLCRWSRIASERKSSQLVHPH